MKESHMTPEENLPSPTDETQWRLLLICAMHPPPISLDVITAVGGLSPVMSLQHIEGLLAKKVLIPFEPAGPGHYQLRQPENALHLVNCAPEGMATDVGGALIDHIEKSSRPAVEKSLLIANVYSSAGISQIDIDHVFQAAEYCLDSGALEAATAYFQFILENLPTDTQPEISKRTYIDAALGVISSRGHLTPLDQQRQMLSQARDFAVALKDQPQLCRVDLRLAQVAKTEGDYQSSAHYNQEAWRIAQELKQADLLKEAALFTADFLFWQGRVADAVARYEEVIGDLEEFPSDQATLRACATLGWCYVICGQAARGISLLKTVRRKAKDKNFLQVIIYADQLCTITLIETGRTPEAEPYLNELLEHTEDEIGNYSLWGSYACKAYILFTKGDLEGCFTYQKKAYSKSKEMGWFHHRGPFNFDYMDALEEMGLVHPEMNYRSEIERMLKWPDVYMQGVALRYRAQRTMKEGGDRKCILADLEESQRRLNRAGAKLELSRTQLLLARLHLQGGRDAEAKVLIQSAWQVLSAVNPKLFPDAYQSYLDEEPQEDYLINTLMEVSNAIGRVRDRNRLLERIVTLLLKLTRAGRGGFFLLRPTGALELVAGRNLNISIVESPEFNESSRSIQKVAKTVKPVISDVKGPSEEIPAPQKSGWRLSYPVTLGEELLGVIYLDNTLAGLTPPEKGLTVLRVVSNQLAVSLDNAKAYEEIARLKDRLEDETRIYRMEMEALPGDREIIGKSKGITTVLRQINQVAGTDASVLISGETGVGKELVARAIHRLGNRREGPFIPVNTAALDPGVVASELFGHEKGAFTGAIRLRHGRFELADRGTLFLDDIDTLSLEIQAKILRALQEKEFERVGGGKTIRSDFRLLAATNQNLELLVKKGLFRSDLYYRLKVFPIIIPSLRERREDIVLLATHFLNHYNARHGKHISVISKSDMEQLTMYAWPGNVRELKHIIERAVILSEGRKLSLPALEHGEAPPCDAETIVPLEEMERMYILKVLQLCNWKVSGTNGAAEKLAIKPTTLYARIRKLGIRKKLSYSHDAG